MSASTREEWLAERMTGVGGSDAAAIMGCNPYKSMFALYAEKAGLAPPDDTESEAAEWGKRLEAPIAEKYGELTGRAVRLYASTVPMIVRHPSRPYMLGSIDADVACADFDGPGILEIKTTGVHLADQWEEAAPLAYQVQLQHYFAVTGRAWGSFAVLIGGQKFKWYDVKRNDTFIAALEERCAWFWARVESGEAPDVDGAESTTEALRALYPMDSGETVDLGADAIRWVEELEVVKAELAALEARKREIDNRVRAAMGPASCGIVPGLGKFSLKLQRREAHTVAASEFRPLRFSKTKEKSR